MYAKTLRAALLASTCLLPLPAWAEDDFDLGEGTKAPPKAVTVNEAGTAIGVQAGAEGRYNRYRGGSEDGAVSSTWFSVQQRATGPDDGTFFLRAEGEDLDFARNRALPDAALSLRVGDQGKWQAGFSYDGIAFQQSDNFHTMFGSSGELLNGLTRRSLATTTSAATAAQVNRYLESREIGTRRDKLAGSLAWAGFPDWKLSTKLEHEHKQGTKANSYFFYNANVFGAIPEPVDYDTDRFTATAGYTTRPLQATFSYIFSKFTNNQDTWNTDTPFNITVANLAPGYTQSELSLPPSNQEHRIKAQFGLNPLDNTHVAVNLSYALQMQDETFKARLYERAPRISDSQFDNSIRNAYGNFALTSRPWKDWNFRAAYTVDQRNNNSPIARQGAPLRADGTSAFNGSGGVTVNPAYSFLNQRVDFEAGYRVLRSTKVTLDYSFKDNQREYSVTNRNQESTVGGRVNTTLSTSLTSSLGYAHSVRQATEYLGNNGWAAMGRTLTGNNSEADLRMYAYAGRVRDEIKANLNWAISPEWSLGGSARLINDEFPDGYYGVTDNRAISAGPDLGFTPSKEFSAHFYYTYQQNYTDLMAWNPNTGATNSNAIWEVENRDTVHTLGARTDWQVTERLKLSAENNLSYGNTDFEEASWYRGTGGYYTAQSLPANKSITNALKLSGEYEIEENLFLGLSGLWERFISKDYLNWQEASSTANQTGTATIGGEGNPGYSAGLLMATARMKW